MDRLSAAQRPRPAPGPLRRVRAIALGLPLAVGMALAGATGASSATGTTSAAGATSAHPLGIGVEFGKCRQIADAAARLACYDAIAYVAAPAPGPGSAPASSSASSSASRSTSATVAPAQAASRAAEPVSTPGSAQERFGLAGRNPVDELQSITSSVDAGFFGWGPNERIRLGNGQVWEVVDGSTGSVGPANRKVTVRRGAFGSFFLDFEGLNISARVRRIR